MHWFKGGIVDAVAFARDARAVFVVYIEGKCAESERFTKFITDETVSSELPDIDFVAIRIDAESEAHHQFAEIYNPVRSPSIFFIGSGGVPLEIVESIADVDDLLRRVESVKRKVAVRLDSPQDQASGFVATERGEADCENGVCGATPPSSPGMWETTTTTPSTGGEPSSSGSAESAKSELSKEGRIEKAKELMEKNREMKKREGEENERFKEMERRKMGQDVQKLKRWQGEQEFKEVVEAREKEKKEQLAARQRVLEQIEQDKADRAARFSSQQQHAAPAPAPAQPPPNSGVARIQFKLPDGSAHNHEFAPDATLAEVKSYVRSNVTLTFGHFVLATMFPRREFSQDDDDSKTLSELGLYPSAVLLVLPLSHGTVATNSSGSFGSIFWTLIGPILTLFNYIRGFLFGAPRPKGNADAPSKRATTEQGESSRPSPKRRAGETTAIRRQGNIHRLTDRTDSDDDNNTWNGNSTQQM